MTRGTLLMFMLAISSSCSMKPSLDIKATSISESNESLKELTGDDFELQSRCMKAWKSIHQEWRSNGGGLRDSMAATRAQIILDKKSKFSALVRRSWNYQKSRKQNSIFKFGDWPVTNREFIRVSESLIFESSDGIPSECQESYSVELLLWDELRIKQGNDEALPRLHETPDTIDWDSPDAQNWIYYWLFTLPK